MVDGLKSSPRSYAQRQSKNPLLAIAVLSVGLALTPAPVLGQQVGAADSPREKSPYSTSSSGQATPGGIAPYQFQPAMVESDFRIDGFLDEEEWASAAVIDSFTQQEPQEGAPATERTEVRVVHDTRRLLIGVRAFDSNPDAIIATEMRRDSDRLFQEDNFQIIIDTFNDHRSGYMFVTSPLGAKLEQQIFEEGEGNSFGTNSNINRNWDGVWNVATRHTDEGWIAEIAIPMMTLRFRQTDVQIWGINFMRNIRRKNEQLFWAPIPKPYGLTRVSMAGQLVGLSEISQGMDLRIKPFLIGGATSAREGGRTSTSFNGDSGLDVKYGLTSSLNLDLTYNTDFAQAEVDEQQVNLTRFGLFFPEKREFFLENAGQFNIATDRQEAVLFFSRRIGLSKDGLPVPIVGGARLTGKVGRHNIAMMVIQTSEAFGQPGENFLVARYSRDILSKSKIGGLVINKDSSKGTQFNRTIAADATFALGNNLSVNSFVAKTSTPGVVDDDMALYGRVGWKDPGWNLFAHHINIQDNFNAEVGFVPRRGIKITKVHVAKTPRPGRFKIRQMDPMVNVVYTTDQNNRLVSRRMHYMISLSMEDGSYFNFMYNRFLEELDKPFKIHPGVTIPSGSYRYGELTMAFNSNPSRRIYQRFSYSPKTFFGGFRKDVDATVGIRVSNKLATELRYRHNDVDLPWGKFDVHLGILRVDYSLSPRMTVRSVVQYNSTSQDISTSIRFNYIYRPGSDLYIVYNELRDNSVSRGFAMDRQLVVKLTYLLAR